jgi:hypothetical protein
MVKVRILILLTTIIVVSALTYFTGLYARGYRYSKQDGKFVPRGLLVLKSNPDGSKVYINGVLKTSTNTNIALAPDKYKVEIKKD